ncbi:hypothetical protein NHX12_015273 [Muraenolepis orangiensis]|uniref:NACHT domain-containing protein n=1 Tax=Muraenolepis orangiensis TaxID=630683 RepID=A0A9Q0DBW4_9TELE|nr:hypothetical protein NHX12_015273 [Muraenolepis orangiensis]
MFEGIAKAGQPTRLNDFYIELLITEGDSGEINKEHEVRLIEKASRKKAKEETPITCEDIVKPLPGQDQPSRTIMTTGVAGIGKTVLTNKFTLDWAEGKANHDIHFIFPFTFRELNLLKGKEFSLVELLHHFFIEIKDAGICRFDQFQVIFILDGLDECRLPLDFQNNLIWTDVTESTSVDVLLTNLIRGNLLPSARIWITTRPAAANQIPAEFVGRVTEPVGRLQAILMSAGILRAGGRRPATHATHTRLQTAHPPTENFTVTFPFNGASSPVTVRSCTVVDSSCVSLGTKSARSKVTVDPESTRAVHGLPSTLTTIKHESPIEALPSHGHYRPPGLVSLYFWGRRRTASLAAPLGPSRRG